MKRYIRIFFVLIFICLCQALFSDPLEIYFGPGGGFSPINRARIINFADGKTASGTLANALIDVIRRQEPDGLIKIALYSMSDYDTLNELIEAAYEKAIHVKLILDAAADWTADSRKKILDRVRNARIKSQKNNKPFDFQIKFVTKQIMIERGRFRILDNGKLINGTMHEKFGLFYAKGNPIPYDGFCGSANVSFTSDKIYAENRVFFFNRPAVTRQFQEEFARLWNEYGTSVAGPCTSEMFVPVSPVAGDVEVYFNAEPENEITMTRLDQVLEKLIDRIEPNGSLDLAMFSLTSPDMARALIRAAERNPKAQIHILLDHSQLDDSNKDESIQGPGLEREAQRLGLKNFQVRYKWRSNAYGYDPQEHKIQMVSFRSFFLHHKVVVVNRCHLAIGSYNWSGSGENLNIEDLMIFNGSWRDHQPVVDAFLREFDTVWNSRRPQCPVLRPILGTPQSVTGSEGRALQEKIIHLLSNADNLKITQALDRGAFLSLADLCRKTNISTTEISNYLPKLIEIGLLCKYKKNGIEGYSQAD